jgi:hypothetical protein
VDQLAVHEVVEPLAGSPKSGLVYLVLQLPMVKANLPKVRRERTYRAPFHQCPRQAASEQRYNRKGDQTFENWTVLAIRITQEFTTKS